MIESNEHETRVAPIVTLEDALEALSQARLGNHQGMEIVIIDHVTYWRALDIIQAEVESLPMPPPGAHPL